MEEAIKAAMARNTRAVYCHDTFSDVTIPAGFQPCDQVWLELYRYRGDSLQQSQQRWLEQMQKLLQQWPGDIGVVPMFYRMGGVPGMWSEQEALDTLTSLTPIVNLSPRIKVIAPFSYQRANGIVANPGLHEAYNRLLAAAQAAGRPTFIPVTPEPPPIDPPVDPPDPDNPPTAEGPMYYGQKIMIRPYGAPDAPFKAVVVRHQDEEYLDPPPAPHPRTLIYALSLNFPSGAGSIVTFGPNGEFQSASATIPGGAERVTFDGKNLMISRPGCAKNGTGPAKLWEVVNL
jgi:hypothetical protein